MGFLGVHAKPKLRRRSDGVYPFERVSLQAYPYDKTAAKSREKTKTS